MRILTSKWWTKTRRECLRLDAAGVSASLTAQILKVHRNSVAKWRKHPLYRKALVTKLASRISVSKRRRYWQIDRLLWQIEDGMNTALKLLKMHDAAGYHGRRYHQDFKNWIAWIREFSRVANMHRREELRMISPGDIQLDRQRDE